jgi:hypothetical protein
MANEINYSVKLAMSNGSLSDSYQSTNLRANQATARLIRNTQSIPNTPTLIDIPAGLVPGMAIFSNLSTTATDYILVGNYTGGTLYPLVKLFGGETQLFRVGIVAANLYAQSNQVAGVMLFYVIYDT